MNAWKLFYVTSIVVALALAINISRQLAEVNSGLNTVVDMLNRR